MCGTVIIGILSWCIQGIYLQYVIKMQTMRCTTLTTSTACFRKSIPGPGMGAKHIETRLGTSRNMIGRPVSTRFLVSFRMRASISRGVWSPFARGDRSADFVSARSFTTSQKFALKFAIAQIIVGAACTPMRLSPSNASFTPISATSVATSKSTKNTAILSGMWWYHLPLFRFFVNTLYCSRTAGTHVSRYITKGMIGMHHSALTTGLNTPHERTGPPHSDRSIGV